MHANIFKSTMFNGLIMGVLFSLNFYLTASKNVSLLFFSYLLIAIIIVVMHRMAKRYRDVELDGFIKYWTVFNYVVLTFLFASIISSIFKVVYTNYINPEYLSVLFQDSMRQIEQNRAIFERFNLPLDDNYFEALERQLKPINYAIQTIWVNVVSGAFLGLIIGGFVRKQKSIFDEPSSPENLIEK